MTTDPMPLLRTDLDWRAIGLGAALAVAVGVPAGLLAQTLDESSTIRDNTGWLVGFALVILVGLGAGGYIAGSRRPDAPLQHGALAAVVAYVAVQTVGIVGRLVDGDAVEWLAVPVLAVLAASAGIAGGLVADRRARTPSR